MAPRAAYRRIADDLRRLIASGGLLPGQMLPSELVLAERYAVARGTVRSALALLVDDGLVVVLPGRGREVAGRVDGALPATAWSRVTAALCERLKSGEFDADAPMPSEAALAHEFGVSRNTIRRAYKHLVEAGLVVVRHGVGAFPATR